MKIAVRGKLQCRWDVAHIYSNPVPKWCGRLAIMRAISCHKVGAQQGRSSVFLFSLCSRDMRVWEVSHNNAV